MFDPIGNENYNEFIELFNISSVDTIDLFGWQIGDSGDVDEIIPVNQGTKIPPKTFALILDAGYFLNSEQYSDLIPSSAIILTINDNTFGSQGFSNSTPETIFLIDNIGDTLSSYQYTLDNNPGFSDEKINLSLNDLPQNWANSNVLNGTPGAINSVEQKGLDVRLELAASPMASIPGQPIAFHFLIRNSGLSSIPSVEISLYNDLNEDSIPQSEELFLPTFQISDTLNPGESLTYSQSIDSLASGSHRFIGIAYTPIDENSLNDTSKIELLIGHRRNCLIINEIMYRPAGGQAEWIEIYNQSSMTLNLRDFKLSDSHIENKFSITDTTMYLHSNEFVVIAEDETIYERFPDIACPVVMPTNGFPALNNDKDQIIIYDLIDSVTNEVNYSSSWGSETGISLERISYHNNSNSSANWALSLYPLGATPGFKNSISPLNYDLEIKTKSIITATDSIKIIATIINRGLNFVSDFNYTLFLDSDFDSIPDQSEILTSFFLQDTIYHYLDSIQVFYHFKSENRGFTQIIAEVEMDNDENLGNNSSFNQILLPYYNGSILINEIMFKPLSNQPEWIEIFNPGNNRINLFNWSMSDSIITKKHKIIDTNYFLNPNEYLILTESSSFSLEHPDLNVIKMNTWPSLNNNSDKIFIYDITNTSIDSTFYSDANANSGVSLERIELSQSSIDPDNWDFSIDSLGSTPGYVNSRTPKDMDIAITEIDYTPDHPDPSQDLKIFITITNVGRTYVSSFNLFCFIDYNRDASLQEDELIFNDPNLSCPLNAGESKKLEISTQVSKSGIFEIFATLNFENDQNIANNTNSTFLSINFKESSLVINEIMYSPTTEQAEWFEIYNTTANDINLLNWSFSDADSSDRSFITNDDLILESNSFCILAQDSSLSSMQGSAQLITPHSWHDLNNTNDDIFLFDPNNNIIDRVCYQSKWGGDQDVSLERINPVLSSSDSSNWHSCVYSSGSTPGSQNSIFVASTPGKSILSAAPNPFSPDGDGHDDVTIINYELPFNLSTVNIKIYDIRGRLVRFLANNKTSGVNNSIIWDGENNHGEKCAMGIYIIYLEALHIDEGTVKTAKATVVLANKL